MMKNSIFKRMTAAATALVLSAAMTIGVSAVPDGSRESFGPTVEGGSFTDDSGSTGNVLITAPNGTTHIPPDDVILEVTDYSEISAEKLEEINSMLENAEAEVVAAETPSDLTQEVDEVVGMYNEMTPETPDIDTANLVVADVFDVSLVQLQDGQETNVIAVPDGVKASFEVTFSFRLPEFFLVLHEPTPGTWVVERNVEKVDDHTFRCTVMGLSPFALIVDSTAPGEGGSGEITPPVEDSSGVVTAPPELDVTTLADNDNNNTSDDEEFGAGAGLSQSGESISSADNSEDKPDVRYIFAAAGVVVAAAVAAILLRKRKAR